MYHCGMDEIYASERRHAVAEKQLNKYFTELGGKGSVHAFLEMGADDKQWETMNSEQRDLWLKLHESGIISAMFF